MSRKRSRDKQPSAGDGRSTVSRAEKKEQARLLREARIRQARRRMRLRRAGRWAVAIGVIGLAVGFFVYRGFQASRFLGEADAAAARIGCGEIEDLRDDGRAHLQPGQEPNFETKPAASGAHAGAPLPPEPQVYDAPFDVALEAQAVHNLEHGYALIYYRQDGDGALSGQIVRDLADLARAETKVLLAPYSELPKDKSLAFVAWTKLQTCPQVTDADDTLNAAKGFIRRFRGGGDAPEPGAV
jgi:hypothetical protein